MPRRTKIIATIGPASESAPVLRKMIEAGMDVARLGLAHGSIDEALGKYHAIRTIAAEVTRKSIWLPASAVAASTIFLNGIFWTFRPRVLMK